MGGHPKSKLQGESLQGVLRVSWEQLPQDGKGPAGRGLGFPEPAELQEHLGNALRHRMRLWGVLCRAESWTLVGPFQLGRFPGCPELG